MTEFYTSNQDPALMARFYNDPKLSPAATKEARELNPKAEPVYIPQVSIEIRIKGSGEVLRRPMQEVDKTKFATAWAVFEGDTIAPDAGTPLTELAGMDDVTVTQYNQKGISSVEDLAAISDNIVSQLGRGSILHKKQAAEFIKNSNNVANRPDILRRIEALEQAVAELTRKSGKAKEPTKLTLKDSRNDAA